MHICSSKICFDCFDVTVSKEVWMVYDFVVVG